MNFLAHSLIPEVAADPSHPDLVAGGFLGDFIKGVLPPELPPALAAGVRLHRRIDAYSNRQPEIRTSCDRFPRDLRRFAPIFVDVVADHLLVQHWSRFSPLPLPTFTASVYQAIDRHAGLLPEHGRRFFDYMATEDLLASYGDTEVMLRSLRSVTRRLRRSTLDHRIEGVVTHQLVGLEQDFIRYFPDLIEHARTWLSEQTGSAP